jgi:hypothetical protein
MQTYSSYRQIINNIVREKSELILHMIILQLLTELINAFL